MPNLGVTPDEPSRSSPSSALTITGPMATTHSISNGARRGHTEPPACGAGSPRSTTSASASCTARTAFLFFLIGGIEALLLRIQLGPNKHVPVARDLHQLFTCTARP